MSHALAVTAIILHRIKTSALFCSREDFGPCQGFEGAALASVSAMP